MKHYSTLVALICITQLAHAQSTLQAVDLPAVVRSTQSEEKIQVMQYRLSAFTVEELDLGIWVKTDSIYYVYNPEFPHYHNNMDFVEFTNFMYEPDFYLMEWLEHDGVDWIGYYKNYGNYTAEGVRTSINVDTWEAGGYVGNSRVEYAYTPEGDIDTILFLEYLGGSYDPYSRHLYTYSDGALANIIQQSYGADWENSLLIIYTYNDEGQIDNLVYRGWDGIGWYDQNRQIYTYDGSGNLIEKLYQYYDFGWVTYGRYVYTYDGTGFNNLLETQSYDGVDFNPYERFEFTEYADGLPQSNTRSLWDGFIYEDYFRAQFYYEEYDDGTVDVLDNASTVNVQIFPNPVTDAFMLSFHATGNEKVSLRITQPTGQTVHRQTWEAAPGENRVQINIDDTWAAGQYFVTLQIGAELINTSLIIK